MFRKRGIIKEIKGKVYCDPESGGSIENSGNSAIGNVGIKLYYLEGTNGKNRTRTCDGVYIYEKRLVSETKTNDSGEFKFYVVEGRYTVELELKTLPKSKGITENNIFIDIGERKNIDFYAREIHSIELKDFDRGVHIGDYVDLNPVLKDRNGNILFAETDISSKDNKAKLTINRLRVNQEIFNNGKVDLNINTGGISKDVSLYFKAREINSIYKVRLSFENGIIDESTKILYYLYSLFDKSRLNGKYKSQLPLKSGTTAVKEIYDYIRSESADEDVVKTAKKYLTLAVPKLDRTYVTPSGYFKIHYTTMGRNAVLLADKNRNGVPDYIELIGSAFEHVKEVTCVSRGFNFPVLEEGKTSFDINVFNLEGKYGFTYPLTYFDGGQYKKRRASCCICVDNNYSSDKGFKIEREGCVKVTAAHEFFHAVQYAYNVDAESWWKEASATWNEDEIYDGVNDYFQYLDNVFSSPEKSLEECSYGGVVFTKHLSENYGGYSIIKRIWEIQSTKFNSGINSIEAAVKERYDNKSLGAVYDKYTAYNFNPSQYYHEGDLWSKSVYIKNTFDSYPVVTQRGQLNHLSADYLLFKPLEEGQNKTLRISIEGKGTIKWGFKMQRRRAADNLCELIEIGSDTTVDGAEIICQGFGDIYKEVCFIPACLEKEHDGMVYNFSATLK